MRFHKTFSIKYSKREQLLYGVAPFLMKSILSLGIEEFCTVEVKSAIEDWLLDDLEGLCAFLKLKETPGAIKGANGYAKLLSLFKRCGKDKKA